MILQLNGSVSWIATGRPATVSATADDAEMPLMRAHLRGCSACRDDHDSLLALLLAGPGQPD
jgi:hypothetical protein